MRSCLPLKAGGVRLPSVAGADAAELAELVLGLGSRRRVYEAVRDVVAEMEVSLDPVVVMIVGEWGEGKTSVFNAFMAPEARARGWLVLEARASAVLGYMEIMRGEGGVDPSSRLLAAMLAAAAERGAPYGAPGRGERPRDYAVRVLSGLASRWRRVVLFVDEFEDAVAAPDEVVADVAAGLVGLVNGDVEEVSSRCRRRGCWPGLLHVVVSLTPPAYAKLVSLRDFATVAARLKRRVRVIRVPPLRRREARRFLEALARYSAGGPELPLESPNLANPLLIASQGNLGALVSLFRALVSRSLELGRDLCGGLAALDARELTALLERVSVAVGGADVPAVNAELHARLVGAWAAYARVAGLDEASARRFMEEALARVLFTEDELARGLGLTPDAVKLMVAEANAMAEAGWVRGELGVSRLFHRVVLVDAEEVERRLAEGPWAAGTQPGDDPLALVVDALTLVDARGRSVVALAATEDGWRELVRDALPVDAPEALVDRIAVELSSRLRGLRGPTAYLLSPKLARSLYATAELAYLDFIADRAERLRLNRRAYGERGRQPLLVAAVALLASEARVVEGPQPLGDAAARLAVELPGLQAAARLLVYAVPGQVTQEEVGRIESTVTAAVLSGWRPHAVLVLAYGGIEDEARRRIEKLEESLFTRVVVAGVPSLLSRLRLTVLGLKVLEAAGSLERALEAATGLSNPRTAQGLGFDPLRLQAVLRQLLDEVEPGRRVKRALEEGVGGAPLVIRDPELGYDVEKPTELAGALRYYLVVPAPKARPQDALNAAHEYVMRYHIHRHHGESRGLLSPDIDRRELTTLERYTALLAANGFLERVDGELRIDVLSPAERSVLKALEQLGARSDWVPASQLWSLLVVAARNPGTRRMLLQSLHYRGLVEVQGRRVDPDRSRVRLTDTPEAARRLLERARELLERLRAHHVLREWGFVVSAKARDYRVGVAQRLSEKLAAVLEAAEAALRAGNVLMSLRLSRAVIDVAEYALNELASRAEAASKKALSVRQRLAEVLEEVRALRRLLEQLLASHVVGGRVAVVVEEEGALEKGLALIDEVASRTFTEEELERAVAQLWEEALARSVKEPGRHTPFYIGGYGPVFEFNYKLWLIYSELSRLGLVELANGDIVVSRRVLDTVSRLNGLVARVREVVEQVAELRRKVEEAGIKVPVAPATLAASKERLTLAEVEGLVEEWRRRSLDRIAEVARLASVAERLGKLKAEAEGVLSEAEAAERLLRSAEALVASTPLAKQAEALRALAAALAEHRARLAALVSGVSLERAESLIQPIEHELGRLRSALASARQLLESLRSAAEREASRLEYEARALARLLGESVELRVDDPLRGLPELQRLVEELAARVAGSGVLSELEVRAYRALVRAKRERGELLFSEAVRELSRELSLSPERTRRLLLALIERGIVEPKL